MYVRQISVCLPAIKNLLSNKRCAPQQCSVAAHLCKNTIRRTLAVNSIIRACGGRLTVVVPARFKLRRGLGAFLVQYAAQLRFKLFGQFAVDL